MNVHNLDFILRPRRIALIGVTTDPKSIGGKVLTNLIGSGFHGVVYPVNSEKEAVMGIPCYPDLKSLPKTPELAVIFSDAEKVPGIVKECGENQVLGIIIMSDDFDENHPDCRHLENQILEEKRKFPGMRIIGPNSFGIIVPSLKLNISFANSIPRSGHVAFISQSGALCASLLDWAVQEHIGFSYFISIGNALDVDFGDLIDYFGEDEKSKSIMIYMESIQDARKFMGASRAFARTKPIVAYKAGRFPESINRRPGQNNGRFTEDALYDAAFQRVGISRVMHLGEIFDYAELIGRKKVPKGPRLAIVTNASGPGVIATDALIASNGVLAQLSKKSIKKLNACLPPNWSQRNPIDVQGDARSKRILETVEILVAEKDVDAVLVILTPQAMTNPTTTAKAIGQLVESTTKPILAVWLGGERMREGVRLLNEAGVATYMTPEQGVHAFMTLVHYSRNLEILYQTPRNIPVEFPLDRKKLREQLDAFIAEKKGSKDFSETVGRKLLESYGIAFSNSSNKVPLNDGHSLEMKLGTQYDPVFGTVISIETGGFIAQLNQDRVLGFPPLNERLAFRMLESLKVWPLLKGNQSAHALNVDKLVEVLIRLSYLAADYPEIRQLSLNPLMVSKKEVIVGNAEVVFHENKSETVEEPYAHLVLKPYPEEYVREVQLLDETSVLLRPIKPEDEPMWLEMLSHCSRETIYARFHYFFQWESHNVATHYCYIDYHREIAIVAELNQGGVTQLIGVGRLIADPDHETAEFALLIADEWQNRGLGNILTDYCLEIAQQWKVKKIIAETTIDNSRMIAVFQNRDFELKPGTEGSLLEAYKDLPYV